MSGTVTICTPQTGGALRCVEQAGDAGTPLVIAMIVLAGLSLLYLAVFEVLRYRRLRRWNA